MATQRIKLIHGKLAAFGFVAVVLLAIAALTHRNAQANDAALQETSVAANAPDPNQVDLSPEQQSMVEVDRVSEHPFPLEREAVGNIDFNEDMSAQVFPPYQGRIVKLFAKIGDNVARGKALFTVESPDLIQADATLIAAAGVLDLTTAALKRAEQLYRVEGIAEKDLQQAISDQQTAEGSLQAARNAVAVFGKSAAEIDRVVKTRIIDPFLIVPSPMTGKITARNAAPGDFVQPGNLPAPFAVADISRVWVNASLSESDMPLVRPGQSIRVAVMAFPQRDFNGTVSIVGATVDPQLHRGLVRAELEDPRHELLPGMFATFVIITGEPQRSPAMPSMGIVREGDGSMTVWTTVDRRRFIRRSVKVGRQHAGYHQIIDGLRAGEQVVTKGAIFLDNLATGES